MTLENVKHELKKLLFDNAHRNKIKKGYKRLIGMMGNPGCSKRAAEKMTGLLNG